jgi:hypothetical protein
MNQQVTLDPKNPVVAALLALLTPQTQAAPVVADPLAGSKYADVERIVGQVKPFGRKKGVNPTVQFRIAVDVLPEKDAFGRPFPQVDKLVQMKRSEILNYFTTSGKPSVRVCGLKFHQDLDPKHDGESIYQTPIKAGDWRHWLGGWGKATRTDGGARFIAASDLVMYMMKTGYTEDKIVDMLKESGIKASIKASAATAAPSLPDGSKRARKGAATASA